MVKKKVYRAKHPTRYKLWISVGDSSKRKKPRKPSRRATPWDRAWTRIITWLAAVDGTARRRTGSRHRGRRQLNMRHPNLYRRHVADTPPRPRDELAERRMRRGRGRG